MKTRDSLLQKRDKAAQQYLHLRLEEEIAQLKEKMSIDVTESEGILYNYILNEEEREKSHSPTSIEDLRKAMPDYEDPTSSLKGELHQLYLHGEVLYYKDDEELSDLVWLDPEATVNSRQENYWEKRGCRKEGSTKERPTLSSPTRVREGYL